MLETTKLTKEDRKAVKASLLTILRYMDERDGINSIIAGEKEKIEAVFKGNVKRDDLARIIKLARSSENDVNRHADAVGILADIWFTEET